MQNTLIMGIQRPIITILMNVLEVIISINYNQKKHVKDESVSNKKDPYLKKYTRKDRQDVITILKLHDIKSLLSYRVWEYDQRY